MSQQHIASQFAETPENGRPVTGGDTTTAAQTRAKALTGLNREQRIAVAHPPGALLVIAGAGTGKTRVLTHRAAFLIGSGKVRPEEMLAITLTNKAAREMMVRLRRLCGPVAERIQVGTFHATCAGLMRGHPDLIGRTARFSIYDEADSLRAITRAMTRTDRARLKPKQVQREISLNKNQSVSTERYESFAVDEASRIVARVWLLYEEELRRADALDFDDLLIRTVNLLASHRDLRDAYRKRWSTVLVDEYQDTNPTQARLLRLLVAGEGRRNFMFVGDDRQVIYGFRLADVRLILEFEQEYHDASVVTLKTNYRSSRQILDGANRLIAYNLAQRPMTLEPAEDTEPGPEIMVHAAGTDAEEAKWIAFQIHRAIEQGIPEREMAVLARRVSVIERVEHSLAVSGISYQLVGSRRFFSRREVKRALAHLRVLVNPRDEAAFAYALEIRPQVGDSSIAKIIAYANRHNLTLLEAASAVDVIPGINTRQTCANVARFALDMLGFAGQLDTKSVSELAHEVIHMHLGVAESLARSGHGDQRVERLKALPEAARTYERQHDAPTLAGWLQDAMLAGRDDVSGPDGESGRVTLGTIHGVKGLEWDLVIGAGIEGRILPSYWAGTAEALEEERRMAYVLITRARRWVVLSYAQIRDGRHSGPSRFISEAIAPTPGDAQGATQRQ